MLIPNMFASLGFMEMMLDERDSDVALEVCYLSQQSFYIVYLSTFTSTTTWVIVWV